MGLFSRLTKKSAEPTASNTFFPLAFVEQYLNQLTGNQRKFLELYLTVPELQAIINYKARVFAGMKIRAEDSTGKEKQIPHFQFLSFNISSNSI